MSGNSGNNAERFNSFIISALIMIKSSSSGKPYFFFNMLAHWEIFNADVGGLRSEGNSPFKYLANFSNSNLTEVNSIEILFPIITLDSGRL